MCSTVRRIWVTLLVGFAVPVGVAIVILAFKPIGDGWIEAAGTWFVGLVGVLALVVLAFWSEESSRRREDERLQLEANNVFCVARHAGRHDPSNLDMIIVEQLEIEVINHSTRVISGVVYEIPLAQFDSPLVLAEVLGPGESARKTHELTYQPRERKEERHQRGAEFRFSLDGVEWSKQYGQPAQRLG